MPVGARALACCVLQSLLAPRVNDCNYLYSLIYKKVLQGLLHSAMPAKPTTGRVITI
jgi:hypothetical protein